MHFWIRRSALAAVLVLSVSACAGENGAEPTALPTTTTTTATTEAPARTTGAGGTVEDTSTTLGATTSPPQVEGPVAPDFVFALADGSSFSLSDEQKPVYLVFWAEW
jgi:hypothetical protein